MKPAPATPRTIAVRPRRPGNPRSRMRVEYPPWTGKGDDMPPYDLPMARQLLIMTSELPDSKRGLLIVLAEYRRALYNLITATEHSHALPQPSPN